MTLDTNAVLVQSTEPGQDTLLSTLPTQIKDQSNLSYISPKDPSLGNIFEDDQGKPDYRALTIHFQARAMNSTKTSTHKMNYGPKCMNLKAYPSLKNNLYQTWLLKNL